MDYTQDFLVKKKAEAEALLHKLQECKYAGSMDGKIEINDIIKIITNFMVITEELKKELNNLASQIKKFAETKQA